MSVAKTTMTEAVAPSPRPSILRGVVRRILGTPKKPTTIPHDGVREALETIVFVVVLVFLLKQFIVEAFVIPTGSMAETLYGYRKALTCPECGYEFQLNCSHEVEADPNGMLHPIDGYCCPNCRYKQVFSQAAKVPYTKSFLDYLFGPGVTSGDRVLVLKAIYHREKAMPGDVVVFKFPEKPQKDYGAQNYIKRMWGVGGQTLAIWRGDLYACDTLEYPEDALDENGDKLYPRPENPKDLWRIIYTYPNNTPTKRDSNKLARELFDSSKLAGFPEDGKGFKLIRKSDVLLEEMKRLVYDNDHQAKTLSEKGVPPRWKPESADWAANPENKVFTHSGGGLGWLRYRHLMVPDWRALGIGGRPIDEPSVIDNFLGYNGETRLDNNGSYEFVLDRGSEDWRFWVPDLIVECQANITDADAQVVLELSKGPNRFQAIFKGGTVTIMRTGPGGGQLAVAPTPIGGPGKYTLKFANVDCRLRVYVNGKAIQFDKPVDYSPVVPETFDPKDEREEGWVRANDIDAPVSLGASGGVEVSKLKIWRDTYYVHNNEPYRNARHVAHSVDTYYVHPGHYLCLGDNSAQSSDSRVWGTVPERLMLGKAVVIFWPYDRDGLIK